MFSVEAIDCLTLVLPEAFNFVLPRFPQFPNGAHSPTPVQTRMRHASVGTNILRKAPSKPLNCLSGHRPGRKGYHATSYRPKGLEPRLEDHGRVIHDEYSIIRDQYGH